MLSVGVVDYRSGTVIPLLVLLKYFFIFDSFCRLM